MQEQIGKESEAPAKISDDTLPNRREYKNSICMSEFTKKKTSVPLMRFSAK